MFLRYKHLQNLGNHDFINISKLSNENVDITAVHYIGKKNIFFFMFPPKNVCLNTT